MSRIRSSLHPLSCYQHKQVNAELAEHTTTCEWKSIIFIGVQSKTYPVSVGRTPGLTERRAAYQRLNRSTNGHLTARSFYLFPPVNMRRVFVWKNSEFLPAFRTPVCDLTKYGRARLCINASKRLMQEIDTSGYLHWSGSQTISSRRKYPFYYSNARY